MQQHEPQPLVDRLIANAAGLLILSSPLTNLVEGKFDNRRSWDDWGKRGGSPFNNSPAWDNWDKRKR